MKKFLFLVLTLSLGRFLYAQEGEIIYHEFEPPIYRSYVLSWQLYDFIPLDLDQDGYNDWFFELIVDPKWMSYMYVQLGYPNPYLGLHHPQVWATSYVEIGDTIATHYFDPQHFWSPELYHNEDHWIGIRWLRNSDYYYGWIEVGLQCDNYMGSGYPRNIEFSIYSMAYCTVPDYPLRVGQTCFEWDGVDDDSNPVIATVLPNPTTGRLRIFGKDLRSADVYNALGQRLAAVQGEGELLEVDLSGQPAGIYFVTATDTEGRKCVRKVVKR